MKTRLLKNSYRKDQIESQLMKVVEKKMIRKLALADTDEDQQPIVFQLPFAKGTSEIKKFMKQLSYNINNKKIHLCF